MFRKKIFTGIFVILFCLCHIPAEAALLYYILDGSGSMWGRVNGEMKIVAARKVLTQLIMEMPDDIEYGLTVYGHRKKGNCKDIEEIIPPAQGDRTVAVKAIETIIPKGKTPIAASISQVAQRLKGRESEVTIVLISDGIETCDGDPCAVTKALKEAGIKFVIHTVGLDVDREASRQLTCIAKAGDGRYFSASNASELLESLSIVQKSVVEKTPVTMPEAPEQKVIKQAVSSSSKSVRIKVNRPGKIRFVTPSWLKKPRYWALIDPETGKEKGRFNSLGTTVVPVGEYQIAWRQYEHGSNVVTLGEVVRIRAGETVEVPLATSIRLNVPSWVKSPRYWALKDTETGARILQTNKLEPFLAPAGEYDLVWCQSEHHAIPVTLMRVRLEPDRLNDITVSTAFHPVPAQWVQKKVNYWGLRSDTEHGTGKWIARFKGFFTPQLVPSGRYRFVYSLSEHGTSESFLGHVEIKTDAMNEFQLNTGVAFILPQGEKPPYLVEIISLTKQGKPVGKVKLHGRYLGENFGHIALAPGTYRIKYRQKEYGATTITLVDSFDLPDGVIAEIEL